MKSVKVPAGFFFFLRTNYRNGKISLKQQRTALTDRFNWPIHTHIQKDINNQERKERKKERKASITLPGFSTNKQAMAFNK